MIHRHGQSPKFDPQRPRTKIVAHSIRSGSPPSGFDPLASPAELKKLGFPTRPDPTLQPNAYAFWQKMFAPLPEFEPFDFEVLPLF